MAAIKKAIRKTLRLLVVTKGRQRIKYFKTKGSYDKWLKDGRGKPIKEGAKIPKGKGKAVPYDGKTFPGKEVKSKGHIGFSGEFEYVKGANGDIFRGPINSPVMTDGIRGGMRFESTPAGWGGMKKVLAVEKEILAAEKKAVKAVKAVRPKKPKRVPVKKTREGQKKIARRKLKEERKINRRSAAAKKKAEEILARDKFQEPGQVKKVKAKQLKKEQAKADKLRVIKDPSDIEKTMKEKMVRVDSGKTIEKFPAKVATRQSVPKEVKTEIFDGPDGMWQMHKMKDGYYAYGDKYDIVAKTKKEMLKKLKAKGMKHIGTEYIWR